MARSPRSRWPLRTGRLKGPTLDSNSAAVEGKVWNNPTSPASPTASCRNSDSTSACASARQWSIFVRSVSANSTSGKRWKALMGATGFLSAMYARIARFNRCALASPATARTWRVSTTLPRAITPTNITLASTLFSLRIQPSLLFAPRPASRCVSREAEREVKVVLHTPIDHATGCWLYPDIHHRQGPSDTTGRGCNDAELSRRARTDSAGTTGKASGRRGDRPMKFGRIVVHLGADGCAALGADVVVLTAGREDQQEFLACRRGAPAARTIEAGRLELFEAVMRSGHRANSTPGL